MAGHKHGKRLGTYAKLSQHMVKLRLKESTTSLQAKKPYSRTEETLMTSILIAHPL